jgi:hypothetical protein
VGAGVAPGQSTITVRGTADDVDDRTATLTLTVTVAGSYTLTATPATLSMAQGAQGQSTINVDRTGGFTGAVALAVTGAPAGLTATLNPASATANTSTLTVAAGASLATGTYTLTITGTTPGLADQTTTVAVTVTSSGGGGSSISIDFSACTDKPIWFAFQDGAGTWTQVAGSGDVYEFDVAAGNAGIAWVSNAGGAGTTVFVQYYTTAELSGGSFDFCGAPLGGKTVNGSVTGLGATDFASVFMGGGSALVTFLGTNFQLQHVASGPQDLVAFRTSATGASASDRGLIRRDQDIANGGSVGTLDMNGAESFAAATAQLTAGGAAAGAELTFLLNYQTGAACHGGLLSSTLPDTPTSATLSGIPAGEQRATDFHRAMVVSTEGNSARSVFESFHTLADRTVNLGAALGAPDVTSLGAPYKRLQADLTVPNEYNAGVSLGYSENGGARAVQISVTDARVGGGSASIVMPDFTGVSGWNAAWAPPAASTVDWAVGATGTNVTGSFCQEGARLTVATVSGTK